MQISKDTVIEKMLGELESAKAARTTKETAASMSHIKLLSELWLEEYEKKDNHEKEPTIKNASTSATYQALQQPDLKMAQQQQQMVVSTREDINEEKDDLSIFDF